MSSRYAKYLLEKIMEKRNNKSLSEIEMNSVNEIYKLLNQKWFFNSKRRNFLLNELGIIQGSRNIRLLKYLLLLALDIDREVSSRATILIEMIMKEFNHKDFLDLDGLFRNTWYCYGMDRVISQIDIQKIIKYLNRQMANKYVLSLLTFHNNGFIREKGIELIYKYDSECALICTILRLNDWVKEIRELSLSNVKKLIDDDSNRKYLLENIPLIEKISSWRRADHIEIIEFCSEKYRTIIDDKDTIDLYFQTNDLYLKRALYHKMTLYSQNLDNIIKRGVNTKDPIILKYLTEFIEKNRTNRCVLNEIHKLAKHKLAAGRAYYLSFIYESGSTNLKEILLERLFDKSSKVRELSRFYLKTKFDIDVKQIYRDSLVDEAKVVIGISSLGELMDLESYEKIESYILGNNKKITLAAMLSLSILDFERSKELLFKALVSDNELYSIRSRKILKKHLLDFGRKNFEEAIMSTSYKHVKENILLLANCIPKWESLHFLLSLYGKEIFEDLKSLEFQMSLSIGRINHGFTRPNAMERENILMELECVEQKMNTEHVTQIKSILQIQ